MQDTESAVPESGHPYSGDTVFDSGSPVSAWASVVAWGDVSVSESCDSGAWDSFFNPGSAFASRVAVSAVVWAVGVDALFVACDSDSGDTVFDSGPPVAAWVACTSRLSVGLGV